MFRWLQGNADARIVMDATDGAAPRRSPDVRLVDGPSPLTGRLQVRHLGEWHSVCTNSRKYVKLTIHLSTPCFFFSTWAGACRPECHIRREPRGKRRIIIACFIVCRHSNGRAAHEKTRKKPEIICMRCLHFLSFRYCSPQLDRDRLRDDVPSDGLHRRPLRSVDGSSQLVFESAAFAWKPALLRRIGQSVGLRLELETRRCRRLRWVGLLKFTFTSFCFLLTRLLQTSEHTPPVPVDTKQ